LEVGVETVVANDRAVPIKEMCGYMEAVFEELKDKRKTLNTVVVRVNKEFEERGVEFMTFKNENYGEGID